MARVKRSPMPELDVARIKTDGGTYCVRANTMTINQHPFINRRYDVVLSFTCKDHPYVERVAETMRKARLMVFYDQFEELTLLGKNLYTIPACKAKVMRGWRPHRAATDATPEQTTPFAIEPRAKAQTGKRLGELCR